MPNPTLALYATITLSKRNFRTQSLRIPDFGYMEIFNACIMASMSPVLCDVTETGVLELRDQEAGIAVHYNGRKAKPTVLEVCFDAIDVHTKGLISVYDFNYQRHLSLGGKGGAVCTDNPDEYNALLRLKDQGRLEENSQDYDYWGVDLQVTELQAAYGLAQLKDLKRKIDTVRGFYSKIRNAFMDTDKLVFLSETPTMYIDVYTREPLKLGQFLAEHGVMANRLPKPLHTHKIVANAQRVDTKFVFSDTLYNAGVFLPSSPIMEEKQVDRIIEVLRKFVELE
jgi:dTDP-4-amino-4,6-dideoxygalactose transaminase